MQIFKVESRLAKLAAVGIKYFVVGKNCIVIAATGTQKVPPTLLCTIFAVDFACKYFARILVMRNTFSTLRAKLLHANFPWDNGSSGSIRSSRSNRSNRWSTAELSIFYRHLFRCYSTQFYVVVFLLMLAIVSLLFDCCVCLSLPHL